MATGALETRGGEAARRRSGAAPARRRAPAATPAAGRRVATPWGPAALVEESASPSARGTGG
ncbi:MAG TPA: hypothetical protein VNK94_02075, partial [Gaiellaceae bacterium]|nr:hypothetical protein [Gaiellaceae bacterium]